MKINRILALIGLSLAGVLPTRAQSPHLTIADTRNAATMPGDYSQKLKSEFKFGTAVNAPSGTFVYTVGLRGWSDDTGGPAHELAFAPNALYLRSGTTAGGWKAWREVLITDPLGNVGIGTGVPKEKLSVNGNIRAKEIKVETTNWPDYVFAWDYKITSLAETERFIQQNGHLPEVPKALDAEANGISLGEMNKILLKKIEELTLHAIRQQKEIDELKSKMGTGYIAEKQNHRILSLPADRHTEIGL